MSPHLSLLKPFALWGRPSGVELRKDVIIPLPPFLPYNPFENYSPVEKSSRKNEATRSLHYKFLDVEADDPEAVMQFVKTFGVLGDSRRLGWRPWAEGILEASGLLESTKAMSPFRGMFRRLEMRERAAGLAPSETKPDVSKTLWDEPLNIKFYKAVQNEFREAIEMAQAAVKGDEDAAREFRLKLGAKLSMVRPYCQWMDGAWTTGWDIGSLEAALYLMLLYDLQGLGDIVTCPQCRRVFLRSNERALYCSASCGTKARVQRHREKKSKRQRKTRRLRDGQKRRNGSRHHTEKWA